ncbi:MAG: MreC domain-containing protein [Planctomycetota bacterium]|jgi:predicted  nucleic acid-binding Zn-ribbon protein
MSTVAKIFVVLNLVFALMYAGVAATLLQKQEHWKYKYHYEMSAHEDTKQTLTSNLTELQGKHDNLVKEVDLWKNKYDAEKTAKDSLEDENRNIEKKWEQMKNNYESLVQKYDELAQDLAEVKRQKDELQQQLNTALSERDDAIHKMDQSVDDRQRLQQQLEDLKVDISNLRQRHVDLAKKKSELEWVLNEVQQRVGIEVLKGIFAPPKIDGAVVGVSSRVNLVVINVGEEDGVRVGFEFTIYRGSSFVGKLVVEKVYPRQAACRVLLDMTKDKVQQGDRVSTQVY